MNTVEELANAGRWEELAEHLAKQHVKRMCEAVGGLVTVGALGFGTGVASVSSANAHPNLQWGSVVVALSGYALAWALKRWASRDLGDLS